MIMEAIHCVYFHRRPSNNSVFYVGMGQPDRPAKTRHRNRHWRNVVKSEGGFIIDIRHNKLNRELACRIEKRYIKFFGRFHYDLNGTLVNAGIGGEGTSGFKMSEESKDKIKTFLKNRRITHPGLIERIAASKIGHKHRDSTKIKMSKNNGSRSPEERERRRKLLSDENHPMRIMIKENHPFLGRNHTEETKRKISNKKMGNIPINRKVIYQYTLEGEYINEYESAFHAAQSLNRSVVSISSAATGRQKTCAGFVWKYNKL